MHWLEKTIKSPMYSIVYYAREDAMSGRAAMFQEDAEKLAREIQDEDPMIEVVNISVDPDVGGYVISIHDRNTGEEYTIDHYDTWAEIRSEIAEVHSPELLVERIHQKHGKKIADMRGEWLEVSAENWPDSICDSLERNKTPGDPLVDLEPTLTEVDFIEPGHGNPEDYSSEGGYLILGNDKGTRIWRRIKRLANLTLVHQGDLVEQWKGLGFDIAPEPFAPLVEPGSGDWSESGVLEEVKDRIIDVAESGFDAILIDGLTNVAAYGWVVAGVLGLEVVTGWSQKSEDDFSASSTLGYTELLNYQDVEDSLEDRPIES